MSELRRLAELSDIDQFLVVFVGGLVLAWLVYMAMQLAQIAEGLAQWLTKKDGA